MVSRIKHALEIVSSLCSREPELSGKLKNSSMVHSLVVLDEAFPFLLSLRLGLTAFFKWLYKLLVLACFVLRVHDRLGIPADLGL